MSKRTIIAPEASRKKITTLTETVEKHPGDQDTPQHRRALFKADERSKFVTLADQIAKSTTYFRNYKYPKGEELYPNDIDMDQKLVTKFYPHAEGGALFVDEPRNEREATLAYAKQKKLKKLGLRHVVVEDDSTWFDCMEQLGEI